MKRPAVAPMAASQAHLGCRGRRLHFEKTASPAVTPGNDVETIIADGPISPGYLRPAPGIEREVPMKALQVTVAWLAVAIASIVPPATQAQSGQGTVACRDEIGPAAAKRLVARCFDASPATHPPCNAVNPCAMIREEIARSCKLF